MHPPRHTHTPFNNAASARVFSVPRSFCIVRERFRKSGCVRWACFIDRTFNFKNEAAGIVQAGFFLKGGGLIELIGPV
jgi:hypothetical protein